MPKANLQRKLNRRVLLPMFWGMIATLLCAYIPFYFSFPSWIDKITNDMISDRKDILKALSSYLALSAGKSMDYGADFLLLSSQLYDKYYDGSLPVKPTFTGYNNYVNGYLFVTGQIPLPPGFNKTLNESFETSIWYNQQNYRLDQLDGSALQMLKDSAVFDSFTRPMIKSESAFNSKENVFQRSIRGFRENGLYYSNPTKYSNIYITYPINNTCPYVQNYSTPLYDPRCRPWYGMTANSSPGKVSITDPYFFAGIGTIGQTICVGTWVNQNFKFASCIDYNTSHLAHGISVINKDSRYAFAVSLSGESYVHPNFNRTCESAVTCISNIISIEMQGCSQKEKDKFKSKVFDKLSTNSVIIEEYEQEGNKIIIAIAPVYSSMSVNETKRVATIGLRMRASTMTDPFDDLKFRLNELMYIEGAALVFIIIVVMGFCWLLTRYVTSQIVKPIDKLIKIVERLKDGDVGINIEHHYELCSKELTKLYTVFTKLKIVLKFGKKEYFQEDAEALMNYAQALTLFLEFRNIEKTGVCYHSMGVIHLRNQRYQEAMACFHKAFELAKSMKDRPDLVIKQKFMLASTMMFLKKFKGKPPQLMIELIDYYKENGEYSKAVQCLIQLAEHTSANVSESSAFLSEAEQLMSQFTVSDVPKEILDSKILYCKGMIQRESGYLNQACELFISCISKHSIFDRETRSKALKNLNEIYSKFGAKNEVFIKAEAGCKNYSNDVVFAIDYSISMNGARIRKTLSGVCKIIENFLKPEDRVAFITFNKTCSIAFNLTPRGVESKFLQEKVLKWDSPKGETSFYDAINLSLQEFLAYCPLEENAVPFDEKEIIKETRVQWIISLVDGEDNRSSYTYKQIKKKIKKSSVNLIIIGLAVPDLFKKVLRDLCQATTRGFYIDCSTLGDLDKALHTISTLIGSQTDDLERLS